MLVIVAVLLYLACLEEASAVFICQYDFFTVMEPEFAEEVGFIVNVSCSEDDLHISWQALEEGNYHASVNYACTDSQGITVYGRYQVVDTADELSGTITSNTPLDRVMRLGGNCTVFGCHQLQSEVSSSFLFNKNASCTYPETNEPTPSTPMEVRPSTSMEVRPLTSMEMKPSTTTIPAPYHTPSPTPYASDGNLPATKAEVLPTPLVHSAGDLTQNHFVTVVTVTISLIISAVVLPVIVLTFIVFVKKRQQKKLRLKYSESALYIEKMDPYYAPVQVDSYLQKCESTKSIFEFLTVRTDYQDNNSVYLKAEKPEEYSSMSRFNSYNHSCVLQLPPLKTHSDTDYQPFTTIISPYHGQDSQSADYFNVQDELNASYWHAKRHVACLNMLFDGKQHCDSSYCYNTSSGNADTVEHNNSKYDVDSLNLEDIQDSESDSPSDTTQDDWNTSAFPPSDTHSSNDNYTTIQSGNECSHNEDHVVEEHLAESNLTINPHHFDPL